MNEMCAGLAKAGAMPPAVPKFRVGDTVRAVREAEVTDKTGTGKLRCGYQGKIAQIDDGKIRIAGLGWSYPADAFELVTAAEKPEPKWLTVAEISDMITHLDNQKSDAEAMLSLVSAGYRIALPEKTP